MASKQTVRTRKVATVPFLANQTQLTDLDCIGGIVHHFQATMTGQLTCTAANNTVANNKRGDNWGACKKIQVIANGGDYVRDFSGADLWQYNRFLFGGSPTVPEVLGDGVTANPSWTQSLLIPFEFPDSAKPFDTAWNTANLTDLKVQVQWGDYTDVNSAATGWTANPTFITRVRESYFQNKADADAFSPSLMTRIKSIVQQPGGAQNGYQIKLDSGGAKLRSLLINMQDTNGQDLNTLISTIRLIAGGSLLYESTPLEALQFALIERGIPQHYERALRSGGTVVGDGSEKGGYPDTIRRNLKETPGAWIYIPFVRGYQSEAIDTAQYNDVHLDMDVAAAGKITVYETLMWGDVAGNAAAAA